MSRNMPLDELRRNIVVLDSIEECLSQAEAVLITTPDPVFKGLTAVNFKNEWAEVLVMDFWRLLRTQLEEQPGIKYLAVGLSENDSSNSSRLRSIWWGGNGESSTKSAE